MIARHSKITWYPIDSQRRTEHINEVQLTALELQDSIPLGELHVDVAEIFKISQVGERPYEFFDNMHVSIVYEMNLDRKRI